MTRSLSAAALGLLLVMGWLACGDAGWLHGASTSDATRFEWILGNRKVPIEMRRVPAARGDPAPAFEYRIVGAPHLGADWMDAASFQSLLEQETRRLEERHAVLKAANASSWGGFLWVLLGLAGQLCFFGRMLVQWWVSERAQASLVPPIFWWLSLAGGAALLGYFVWRRDPIGILGQSGGALVYARNLWLIRAGRDRVRDPRRAAANPR